MGYTLCDVCVDEIDFEEDGVAVRILILRDLDDQELNEAIEKLRVLLGCKVELWVCSTSKHMGDNV